MGNKRGENEGNKETTNGQVVIRGDEDLKRRERGKGQKRTEEGGGEEFEV